MPLVPHRVWWRGFAVSATVALLSARLAFAQCSGFPAGGILNGTLNTYYPGPNTTAAVVAPAGATCIRVADGARQGAAATIAAGDLLLVIQMQGATIDARNNECYGDNSNEGGGGCASNLTSGDGSGSTARTAGAYEYVVATSAVTLGGANACGSGVTSDFVNVTGGGTGGGLINGYTTARITATEGQQTYQVVRVPQYQTAQVGNSAGTATVTAFAWNGRVGGIIAFDVAGTLTVQTNSGANPLPAVNATGVGFRGGVGARLQAGSAAGADDSDYRQSSALDVHANKAEGIAGTPSSLTGLTVAAGAQGYPNGDRARGGPGNAGGGGSDGNEDANDENSGGGGGGNGGKGGKGGNAWDSEDPTGGFGGAAYTASATLLVMGGGGGAGTNNNTIGKSGGAAGGGMIFVRADTVAGTAAFLANGDAAVDLETLAGNSNDSGGGGGAGGSIVVLGATALPATLTLTAQGGFGANANAGTLCVGSSHGPGGGGAGGVILTSNTSPTRSVTGANPGLTNVLACDCPTPAANKVPAGDCNTFGATAGAAGQTSTTTVNGLPGVRTCVTSTRSVLAGLSVDGTGEVSFATTSERDTLAFRLYESDARGGALRPLTGASIPARGRASIGPNVYSTPTAPLERPFVVVEEIETSGHRRRLGPFAADDATLRAGFAAAEERLHREQAGRRAALEAGAASALAGRGRVAPIRGTPARAVTQIKVTTRGAGPVTIDAADLLALGVDPRVLKSRSLRAFNLGRAIPLEVLRSASRELLGVRFVAEPLLTDFTDENAYVLTFAAHPPPAPAVPFTRSGTPLEPGALRVEQDSFYVPWVPMAADPWLWGVVFQDVAPAEFSFDLPGLTTPDEDVAVRVGLVGATDGEHEVEVSLNGQPLGAVHFSGKAIAEVRGLVPAGALGPSGNALRLQYSSDDPSGFALLDTLDLGVVAELAAPAEVLRMEPYDTGVAALGRADYLIVAPAEFQDAAVKLARAKGVLGRRARVVEVERAFDRYAAGVFEAKAIAALLREARRLSPGLRDVLLLGDDTFDPRGHLGLGLASRVPSLVGFDGQFGRVPSETAYADIDGDGAPDVAIGRLPAASADEADRLVEKVVRQQELLRPGKGRHVLAVDDEGSSDLNFRRLADAVAGTLPAGSTPIFADLTTGVAAARATLLQSLRDGAAAVHYFGHGANDFWADERLLDIPALQELAGSGRASLALSWTCEADWYQYHLGQSLGEALLFVPDGGAVAAFGPSGITNPRAQAVFHRRLYPLLLKGIPVGEAVRRAKAAVAREEPWALPVLAGFNLLGDPALVLP